MLKNEGFSLVEVLVALVLIGIVTVSVMPFMTKMSQNKTGVDKNTIICITESPADWYKEADGTTEIPAEGTKCRAAVTDVQHNRGKALKTAKWYAKNGAGSLKAKAKKLLRTACDLGGEKACDYFINDCWKSGKSSEPYCDDEDNFLDLTYYLHQYLGATPGAVYIKDKLEGLLTKNITNLVNEVNYACFNDQKPNPASQNLGDNIACELLDLNIAWWIKQCNSGNEFACEYCYDKQYNRSCTQVKSVWDEADSVIYRLTAKGDPAEPGNTPIDVYCDMTNLASAAISGCGYDTAAPHISRDCEVGHINGYNRSCVQVKTEWDAAPTGNFELTHGGAGSPVTVYCNTSTIASAAITGCGYNTTAEGDIPANEYVPGDCAYGRTENYNRDCDEILSAWPEMIEGSHYHLTAEGDVPPHLVSSICPVGPLNTCFNPNGATTTFFAADTGLSYDFEVTNCNQAYHDNIADSGENPCGDGNICGDEEPGCWYGAEVNCKHSGCGNPVPGHPVGTTDKYICNHPAAVKACHALNGVNPGKYGEGCAGVDGECTENSTGWRLPTLDEMQSWRTNPASNSYLTTKAYDNLDLCGYYTGNHSTPKCWSHNGCPGVDNGVTCTPDHLWTAVPIGSNFRDYYYHHFEWKGPTDYSTPQRAFAVRCVRSLL